MQKITNTIKQKYYVHREGEFMPIYRDGVLDNAREFHSYKLKCAVAALGRVVSNA